jgi:hypothetical protein
MAQLAILRSQQVFAPTGAFLWRRRMPAEPLFSSHRKTRGPNAGEKHGAGHHCLLAPTQEEGLGKEFRQADDKPCGAGEQSCFRCTFFQESLYRETNRLSRDSAQEPAFGENGPHPASGNRPANNHRWTLRFAVYCRLLICCLNQLRLSILSCLDLTLFTSSLPLNAVQQSLPVDTDLTG